MGDGTDRTILEVLADLEDLGFSGQFVPRDGGEVECMACERRSQADATVLRHLRRLEGASDPSEMMAVVGLECPFCGTRGTAVLSYGPEASALDADVLARFEDCRPGR